MSRDAHIRKETMENINNKKEFVRDFAQTYGYTQGSVNTFLSNLKEYLENAIREGIDVDINGILHMYYSFYPSRMAPPLVKGSHKRYKKNEYIEFHPVMRVRFRVPENMKKLQKEISDVVAKKYENTLADLEENDGL